MNTDNLPSNVGSSTSALKLEDSPQLIAAAYAPSSIEIVSFTIKTDAWASSSPDGSCALALAEDRSLSLFILPSDDSGLENGWTPEWTYHPPDSILSFEWFPGASPNNPPFFAFAVAIKDHPIHLLDGFEHRLRASYSIIDHQERFIAPHSMAFSPEGARLYCGFENAIEVIDISRPGCAGHRVATSPTRASKSGQKGIISSLAFRPDLSGLLAAGSFSGTVGLYDTTSDYKLVKLLRVPSGGGVTKVSFHPAGHLLYVASRLSNTLQVWDLRNLKREKGHYERAAKTNQRLGFGLDASGTWLVAGDQRGTLHCYSAEFDPDDARPIASFHLANAAISNADFIPGTNLILTSSGNRTFDRLTVSDLDSDSDSNSSTNENDEPPAQPDPTPSLQLWQLQ